MIEFSGSRPWGKLTAKEQDLVNWHRVEVRGVQGLAECSACPGDGIGDSAGKTRCKTCHGDGAVPVKEV